MASGGFDSPLAPLRSQTQGCVPVCSEQPPFYGGEIAFKLTSLSVFKAPCVITLLQGYVQLLVQQRDFQQCLLSFSGKTFDKPIAELCLPPTCV